MSTLLSNNGRKSFERKSDDKSITNSDKSIANLDKPITSSIPTSNRVSCISYISGITNLTYLDSSSDDKQSTAVKAAHGEVLTTKSSNY